MPKITRIQERDCVSENLGQDDEIEETYWGTLCISNIFAVPGWDELKFSLYIIRPRPIISLKKPTSLNERPILVYVPFFFVVAIFHPHFIMGILKGLLVRVYLDFFHSLKIHS